MVTNENIQALFNCSEIRAQKFIEYANGDEEYLMYLLEREAFKQTHSQAIREIQA
ncbi:hypothetical protein [Staphylococcus capitis]|uniref:hypothetical protein n=1 Tax=Staphylococcus capitis TaxID=29388 RepID=UPI001BCB2417|nr:hypothetical protein [Staphylococcus capitis]